MTKFKRILFGVLGFCIFAAPPLAHAEQAGQRIQAVYNQLHLTDDQKKQLEANKQRHRALMATVRREMKADKEALKEELMRPRLDMPKINGLHNQIKALLSQMEDNKLTSILAVRSILTLEQFTKFVNLMHKHGQEHESQEKNEK